MKGDYSRSSFSPRKRYSSVRMQQGRVQLDADWNEQADILRHAIETQARDLIGSGAAPDDGAGFALDVALRQHIPDGSEAPDLVIGAGCYYVEGLRCDNDTQVWYSEQPGASSDRRLADTDGSRLLAYLDVWERHVTAIEDPDLREAALGGPDTTARTKTIWQVKLLPLAADGAAAGDGAERHASIGKPGWADEWRAFVEVRARKVLMAARYNGYGGALGNHLYRIEIHSANADGASFKWSRENGAVAFPIIHTDIGCGPELSVRCTLLERNQFALVAGDTVELEDDQIVLGAAAAVLCRVEDVRLEPGVGDQLGTVVGHVRLSADPSYVATLAERWQADRLTTLHPLLRRWDRANAEIPLPGASPGWEPRKIVQGQWYELEHGLEVCFDGSGGYTPGDYWHLVARTDSPQTTWTPRPPDGVVRRCAPLGLLTHRAGAWRVEDLRQRYRTTPRLSHELDAERCRLDATTGDVARLRADIDALLAEIGYLRHKLEDVHGRLQYDYRADEQLGLGELVAADPSRAGYIVRLCQSHETLVIGVVGEILDNHGAPIYRVVIYGRVPCKVVGAVAPGDLLTVASEDGYARRGGLYLRPGTVIGKALGVPAPDGTGAAGLVEAMVYLA